MPYGYGMGAPTSPWSRPTPYGGGGSAGLRPDQRPGTPMPLATGRITRTPTRVTPWERMGIRRPRGGGTQRPQGRERTGGDQGDMAGPMLELILRILGAGGGPPYNVAPGEPVERQGLTGGIQELMTRMLAPRQPSLFDILSRYQPTPGLGGPGRILPPGERPFHMI